MNNANMASATIQSSGTNKPFDAAHFFGLIEKIKEVQEADPRGTWIHNWNGRYDPYETPKPTDEWGICIVCRRLPNSRKCAQCGNDWVCCKSCEMYMAGGVDFDADRNDDHDGIIAHKTACRNRPKTTADKIAL
ncbi:hypothetical protein CMUS01_16749, partial [Colletotrichum musicola]